jgi:hypothetical protein
MGVAENEPQHERHGLGNDPGDARHHPIGESSGLRRRYAVAQGDADIIEVRDHYIRGAGACASEYVLHTLGCEMRVDKDGNSRKIAAEGANGLLDRGTGVRDDDRSSPVGDGPG